MVAEARSRRDGAAVELIGTYAPRNKGEQIKLDLARVDYWISKGAKPTDTLNSMIKKARKSAAAAQRQKFQQANPSSEVLSVEAFGSGLTRSLFISDLG